MTKDKSSAAPVTAKGVYRFTRLGESTLSLHVDSFELPLPERRFAAQCFSAEYKGAGLQFNFGQRFGGRLTSVIGIQLEPGDAMNYHQSLTPEFRKSFEAMLPFNMSTPEEAQLAIQAEEAGRLSEERFLCVSANICSTETTSSSGATLDWYLLPARTLQYFQRGALDHLSDPEPVVEIRCSLALFLFFVGELDRLVKTIPPVRGVGAKNERV